MYSGRQALANSVDQDRIIATECGVWLGSKLFATHSAILQTLAGSKMDLLKRSIG